MPNSPKVERKLAAIVFTDIVGFTTLSAENEPAALSLLEKQREILKPIVESHNGKWIKEKFITYPIPKQIIEEYNKVFNPPS